MIRFTAAIDTSGVAAMLRRQERRIASASATALTRVAQTAKREIEEAMPRVFDRPTRWTLGALRTQSATRDRLESAVLVKDRNAGDVAGELSHLWPQVRGGSRRHKPFEGALKRRAWITADEYLVPAKGAPLDAFGNVPASVIRQILSQLGAAQLNEGYNGNVKRGAAQSAASKRRQLKAGSFFIPRKGGGLPRGIYQRKAVGAGQRGGNVWATRMIFVITGRPRYSRRLPFYDLAERVRDRDLQREFDRELARISQD